MLGTVLDLVSLINQRIFADMATKYKFTKAGSCINLQSENGTIAIDRQCGGYF